VDFADKIVISTSTSLSSSNQSSCLTPISNFYHSVIYKKYN